MFERYTEKARRVIFYARYEASRFGATKIEPEHLLLGLVREAPLLVNQFLTTDISEVDFRERIVAHTVMGEPIPTSVDLPLSDSAKGVLAYGAEEADRLGHRSIGPEHLTLGLLREENSLAARLLQECGAEIERARKEVAASPEPVFHDSNPAANARFQEVFEAMAPPSATPIPAFQTPKEQAKPRSLFDRYTDNARKAIFFAREEARALGSPYIETEHLLLGLLREDQAMLERFLSKISSIETFRKRIEKLALRSELALPGEKAPDRDLPLSNECKRGLAYSAEEAKRTAYPLVGPGHLILGLMREEGCFAARALHEGGADIPQIRQALVDDLRSGPSTSV